MTLTDAIRRNLVKIQDEVDFDEIETFLFQEGAINVEEREILENEPGNTRKVRTSQLHQHSKYQISIY